ncbi:bifunctional diguanylate cyclase/phosphodiesterase [Roseateles toxinivorans]|uniref:PAS domain S-box-containing protein/diguanylate cyclase (GGDEF)-like protein n=1 Tax=Roseateles toxinivorans TaxID=270368 RepID=A0A4R6QKX1_9BURK|nr:diguanylate cyclase [Roseateles toxinivorans]TDP71109.1 PAS domain S-box-containing protein/diguanylate cyclase (GGDEF)-like protein [Roseateles toxinivorans]
MSAVQSRRLRRSFLWLGWISPVLGLLVVLVGWALLLSALQTERKLVESEAFTRVRGLTQAFEEQILGTLQQVDQITRFVAHGVAAGNDRSELVALMRLALEGQPQLTGIAVTDAQGRVIASSGTMARQEWQQHEAFRVHAQRVASGLFIAKPNPGPTANGWTLQMSRRLGDERFDGVVLVATDPSYFTSFYNRDQLGEQGLVTFVGLDWVVRARRSGDRVWHGSPAGAASLANQIARAPSGTYQGSSNVDGVQRLLAYKTVTGHPFAVVTGLAEAEVFAAHDRRRTRLMQVFGLASLALVLAFAGLHLMTRHVRQSQLAAQRARVQFEAASDASLDAFWIMDAVRDDQGRVSDFRFAHCNERGARLLRRPKSRIVGRLRSEVLGSFVEPGFFELFCRVMDSREPAETESRITTPEGPQLELMHQIVPVGDGVALTTRDISAARAREREMLASQQALREADQRVRLLTDNIPALISQFDAEGRIIFANRQCAERYGRSQAELIGKTVLEVRGEEGWAQLRPQVQRVLAGEAVSFESHAWLDGELQFFQQHYVPDLSAQGQVQGFYSVSMDVSALKRVERQLLALARTDTLTGLANRRLFDERLAEALLRQHRNRQALALLFLDIDRFKGINDRLGHASGDAVLVEFAQRLKQAVRACDTVARLAGDEFVVLLEGLHGEGEAQVIAAKIVAAMQRPFELPTCTLEVTTSIGVGFHGGADLAPAALLQLADQALYEAKHAGRNTFRVASAPAPLAE